MTYSLAMTELFRTSWYIESNCSLFAMVVRQFGGINGRERLAKTLGISLSQAAKILADYDDTAFCRVAYHYGLMPDGDNETGWRELPMLAKPYNVGPPLRWTPRLVLYLTELFSYPSHQPDLERLAWRMDTTPSRLRNGMRRYGIPVPLKEHGGSWLDQRSTLTWQQLLALDPPPALAAPPQLTV